MTRFIGAMAMMVLAAGCQFPLSPAGAKGSGVQLTLTVTQPSLASSVSSRLLLNNASSVTVELISEGEDPEVKTLPRITQQVTFEFSLVPLKSYTIKATARDQGGTALFYGETTVSLTGSEKGTLNLLPLATPVATLKAIDQSSTGSLGSLAALAPGAMANYRFDFGSTASLFTFTALPSGVDVYVQNPDGSPIALAGSVLNRSALKSGSLAWVTYHNSNTSASSAAIAPLGAFTIPVTSLTLGGPDALGWAEQADLTVSVLPTNATPQALSDYEFSSSDTTVVQIDASGHLVAQNKDGTANILVKWKANPTAVFATKTVQVAQVPLTALAVTQGTTATLATGSTLTLTTTPTPLNATNPAVTWTSSAPALASVDPATGLVTALLPGTVTITATSTAFPAVSASTLLTLTPTKFTVESFPALALPNAPNQTIALAGSGNQLWALTADQAIRTFSAGLWEKSPTLPAVPSATVRWLAADSGNLYAASPTAVYSFDRTGSWTLVTAPPAGTNGLASAGGVLWVSSTDGFLWSWQGGVWQKGPALPAGFQTLGGGDSPLALTGSQVFTFNGSTWDAGHAAPAQASSLTFAYQSILILVVR